MDYVNMSDDIDIEKYKEEFAKNTSKWDYLISQNPHSTKIFKSAFDFKYTGVVWGFINPA